MMNKKIIVLLCTLVLSSCGGGNNGGSDPTTYSSCSISNSQALSYRDKGEDNKQCFNLKNIRNKDAALEKCTGKSLAYMKDKYGSNTPAYTIRITTSQCF